MTDQGVFRLIRGGATSPPPALRPRRTRPAYLRLVEQAAEDSPRPDPAPPDMGPPDMGPLRPLCRPTDVALRLADWSEAVRDAGHAECADRLCLMAWEAYDRPVRDPAAGRR